MKAFLIDRYKPSDGGRIADVPDPVPANGQVLVEIHAAGVNQLDSKIRSGDFRLVLPYRMPLILGNDLAARVVQVGPGVRRFNVGDEVYARPHKSAIGTFAERIAVNEADLALKPTSLSMEQAASIPLVSRSGCRGRATSPSAGHATPDRRCATGLTACTALLRLAPGHHGRRGS